MFDRALCRAVIHQLALLKKLKTKDMLVKKGLLPSQVNLCSFWAQQQNDIDHLLLNCQIAWSIWCNIAAGFEVQLTRQQRFRHFYEAWMSKSFHNTIRKKLFILAFFAVAWSLWTKRNKIVFEQQELDIQALQLIIRWRIALWSKAWKDYIPYFGEQLAGNFSSIPMLFP